MGVAPSSCNGPPDDEAPDDNHVDVFSLIDLGWKSNPRQLASLCAKCTSMVSAWQEMRMLPEDTEQDLSLECEHYETFDDLVASAQSGCGICYQLSRAPAQGGVKFKSDLLPPSKIVCWVGSARKRTPERYYFWLQFLADLELKRPPFRTLWIEPAIDLAFARNYNSVAKPPSTQDALPLCKAWLRKCRENHPGCGPPSARTLPTRLLFLGEEVPRLVVTASIQDEIEYATLSHCWGTLKFTTLTSKTLTDFQTAIPVDALTKTFKEAISIAKYLDIEYLWIDSLCIIQDSAEDWRRESSLMGQVYGYADLNIAATAAADGSGGCFFDRNPSWRCQIRTGEGVGWTLWDCWRDGWKNPTSNSLLPRAWVVQERYLSRRVLHFTDDQVYWECERCPACEIYPSGYPADQKRDHYPEGFQYRKKPLGLGTWSRMVDAYSAAKLTKYSDRYAAIEGPARMIHAELGWEFVAGMWKQDLERQLCWAASLRLVNTPCTIGRSPSWSWMSVKGKIKADEPCDNVTHLAVEVDSLDVEYVSGNMFDGAERAVLRLRCEHLFRGVIKDIHPKHQKDDAQTEVDAGKSSPSEATTKPHFARSFLGGCYFGPDRTCSGPEMIRVHWDTVSIPNADKNFIEACLLPVKIHKEVGLSQAWGLVLQATGKGTGQYRRIGAFQPTRILRHDVNAVLERMFKQTDCVALEQTECFAATKMREGEALMCYIDVV